MHPTSTGPEAAPDAARRAPGTVRGAYFALAVLFSMNLLNYIDRYVFFAVGASIQKDLHISDRWFGPLAVSFMIVYTLVSPVVGWLGDRYSRRMLLAVGVGLWSVATVGTAFSRGFGEMFVWRALLGVGEASYGAIAPALLADLFPTRLRGRVIGLYYLALPLGGALGYGVGGWVDQHLGWEAAFLVVGLPGLGATAAALLIRDPGRGASEGRDPADRAPKPGLGDYLALFRNRTFLYNTFGMAAVTFASGGYAAWGAIFYQRIHGLSVQKAGFWIGGLTALAGLLGIPLGTVLADLALRRTRRAYLLVAVVAVALATPFALAGILDPDWRSSLGVLFAAMVLLASVLGPCNTVTANVVPANQRAAGYALSVFLIHLFGDISSPVLIGELSGRAGRPSVAGSPIGQALAALGAGPVETPTGPTNLTVGMLAMVPVLALGALLFLFGSRHLAEDQDRAQGLGEKAGLDGDALLR